MALSKHEQHTLDEIEQALCGADPKFVNTVSFDHLRRHRAIVAGTIFGIGLVLLVTGEIASQLQLALGVFASIIGFLVMLAAITWMLRRPSHR